MKRWAFNILAGASLVLCVLTAGLWLRSYWVIDYLTYRIHKGFVQSGNATGAVYLQWAASNNADGFAKWSLKQRLLFDVRVSLRRPDWRFGPVESWRWEGNQVISVRHWFLVLLFSLPPAAWLLRGPLLRRRRRKLGLCRHCGYDLRATPGRCPECGRENCPSSRAGDAAPP